MAPQKNKSIVLAEQPTIVPLSSLKANQEDITIVARIMRRWDVCIQKGRDKPSHTNGTKILARMEVAYIYKFGSLLTEGTVVSLSNFKLVPANGEYRPTHHDCGTGIQTTQRTSALLINPEIAEAVALMQ